MLYNTKSQVVEQTIWVIGNIIADMGEGRDAAMAEGIVLLLVACLLRTDCPLSTLRVGAWCIFLLCHSQPYHQKKLKGDNAASSKPALPVSSIFHETNVNALIPLLMIVSIIIFIHSYIYIFIYANLSTHLSI